MPIGSCLLVVSHEVSAAKLYQLTDLLDYEDIRALPVGLFEQMIFELPNKSVRVGTGEG